MWLVLLFLPDPADGTTQVAGVNVGHQSMTHDFSFSLLSLGSSVAESQVGRVRQAEPAIPSFDLQPLPSRCLVLTSAKTDLPLASQGGFS